MLGLDRQIAAPTAGRDRELGSSGLAQPFGARAAQFVEAGETALVAPPPRGHAALQPALLPDDLAVQLMPGLGVARPQVFGPVFEMGEALVQAVQAAAIEPQGHARQVVQECPVVADGEQGALEAQQLLLEPLDGRQVEMVGRFVEQQHVRVPDQGPGERRAPALAAGQRAELPVCRQANSRQHRRDPVPGRCVLAAGCAQAGGDVVGHGLAGRRRRVLGQVGDGRARLEEALAAIGLDGAGQELEQGRLARAVAPDQAGAHAAAQAEGQALEQRRSAEANGGRVERDQGSRRRHQLIPRSPRMRS
jgi:hypothetical protein